MSVRSRQLVTLAGISSIEGVFFIGYALFDVVGFLRFGLTGPEEVSNPSALTLQVVMFALFGAALVLVSRGWWRVKRWARAPFVLAQLLVLVVAVPLTSASGSVERISASIGVFMAGIGLVLTFLPSTTRALIGEDPLS